MTARTLTPDEIIRLGQEYEDYRRWETVRDFAERLYGPRAHHVTISVMSEYNDSSYDERVSILVTDRDGAPVPVDFSLPWWSQFAIAEERMMHYIQNASGSIEAAGELDGQGEVYAELRAFCVDELGIELSEHWRAHDPITYDYVLDAPPAISFLRVYTDEIVA